MLDYGTFLLEPGSVKAFKKLDLIQSKALRIVSGAMRSSPINALQVECGDPPLHLRRQYLADKFIFRSFQFLNHSLYNKLQQLSHCIDTSAYWRHKKPPCLINSFKKFINIKAPIHRSINYPLFNTSFEALMSLPEIHFNFDLNKHDICTKFSFNLLKNTVWVDYHHIFTDASKHSSSDPVGVGVYHAQFKISQKIKHPPETSVFTGECYDIFKAIEYIILFKLPKTIIFSDSKSALQSLNRFPFK